VIALPFVPGNPTLAIIASIAGFCVAPTLIGLFSQRSGAGTSCHGGAYLDQLGVGIRVRRGFGPRWHPGGLVWPPVGIGDGTGWSCGGSLCGLCEVTNSSRALRNRPSAIFSGRATGCGLERRSHRRTTPCGLNLPGTDKPRLPAKLHTTR
jgi:hypothetical protein